MARIPTTALKAVLRRLAEELGRPPTGNEVDALSEYSKTTYYNRSGSYAAALEAAGLGDADRRTGRIPTDDLLDELHRVGEQVDRAPTASQMNAHGEYSVETYRNRFGSWRNALETAGFTIQDGSCARIPTDELLNQLEAFADELGHPPSSIEIRSSGPYSPKVYIRRFGSWRSALSRAGVEK